MNFENHARECNYQKKDISERAYWVRLKRTHSKQHVDSEKLSLQAKATVNPEAVAALTTPKKGSEWQFWDLVQGIFGVTIRIFELSAQLDKG